MIVSETVTESTILPDIQAQIAVLQAYRKDLYKSGNSTKASLNIEGTGGATGEGFKINFVMIDNDEEAQFLNQFNEGKITKEELEKIAEEPGE